MITSRRLLLCRLSGDEGGVACVGSCSIAVSTPSRAVSSTSRAVEARLVKVGAEAQAPSSASTTCITLVGLSASARAGVIASATLRASRSLPASSCSNISFRHSRTKGVEDSTSAEGR